MIRHARRILRRLFRRRLRRDGVYFAWRWWTWQQLCQGWLATGGIGSGKSYRTEALLRALIASGCPVLSTAVKVDEADRYERICRELGCLDRFVRITPETHAIDVMGELTTNSTPADAAAFLMNLADIEKKDSGQGDGAAFWRAKEEAGIDSAIRLCLATGTAPSILNIYKIVMSSPTELGQGGKLEAKVRDGNLLKDDDGNPVYVPANPEYDFDSPPTPDMRLFPRLMRIYRQKLLKGGDAAEYNRIYDVFMKEICATDKIYGGVMAGLTGILGRFVLPPMLDALNHTTLSIAEIEARGLVVVIDYPLMKYHTAGRLYACIYVMLAQRYLMARSKKGISKTFIIFIDDAGWTLHPEWDSKAHNTLRSQQCCDIAIVQDLNTLEAALGGGQKAHHEAMAFASNHMHKLFFGNYSHDTNKWASDLSGQYREVSISSGHCEPKDFMGRALGAQSVNWSFHYQPVVRPEHFNQLPVGHAYLMSGGRVEYVNFRRKR